ncbi:MAG: ATP-dependent helicase [Gammaproteobacteria bacterium]|nr:MAG: ATP-dependent helicase [Gammaproteobacteria bacterium]
MQKQTFTNWLLQQQPTLENVIHNAALAFYEKHKSTDNFRYDLQKAQQEAYHLTEGKDLCYDRYTTPLTYSLWYQARRINVFLTQFADKIMEACDTQTPIEIFDLGAGTGCVQICFGLGLIAYMRNANKMPMLRIINVDSSPFMLDYLRSYLWPEMIKHYPELQNVPVEYHVYSWSNRQEVGISNPWICASYLFDSTDNKEYLESNFNELIATFAPSKVLLLTSAQENKRRLMLSLSGNLQKNNYKLNNTKTTGDLFQGTLPSLTTFREKLRTEYGLRASTYPVSWRDHSFDAIALEKLQSGMMFNLRDLPDTFDIFNPPLRVRRNVELNELQEKAARFETNPTVIVGPAGCGKSVVITEKIINVLEHFQWQKPLTILVTTFNKSLIKQLRAWLVDLLCSKGRSYTIHEYRDPSDGTGIIKIRGDQESEIKLVHFEMLPKLVGRIVMRPFDESLHINKLTQIIADVRQELDLNPKAYTKVMDAAFLMEEYHRVIFGLQCKLGLGEEHYQNLERSGRGNNPKLDSGMGRKAVWKALHKYALWMHRNEKAGHSFIARRQLFYNKLKEGQVHEKFDYIFVDEFQDCTPADFEIMSMLVKEVNNLHIAGDLAQAVHIGKAGSIPRDDEMNRRTFHRLKGSYRLPFRVCEALQPLSSYVSGNREERSGTEAITPYKGAPPGARPIIVFASDTDALSKKIISIRERYRCFDVDLATILERDNILCNNIRANGILVETSTILKLKGLEKNLVVWSLQAPVEFEKEIFEFAYTITTRTNCLLIIAGTSDTNPAYRPVLNYLNEERLIFWDHESERAFREEKTRALEVEQEEVS